MAPAKRRKSTASNTEPAGEDRRAALFDGYLGWLEGRPLAARSREAYGHQVRRYLAWLGDRSPVDGDPLVDGDARDWAVRDYKRHLKAVERWKPASVNLALAALDSFYTQLGLGRPVVRRENLPAAGAAGDLRGAAASAVADVRAGVGAGSGNRCGAALHGPASGGARRARRR
jgi:Phage integrase, N-terminal SAM-like domain